MKKIQWAAGIILGFAVMAVLLITSFEIAMYADFGVYEREYEKYDVLSDLDMTMEDTMYVTHEMMAYLRGDRDTSLSLLPWRERSRISLTSRTGSIWLKSGTFSWEA